MMQTVTAPLIVHSCHQQLAIVTGAAAIGVLPTGPARTEYAPGLPTARSVAPENAPRPFTPAMFDDSPGFRTLSPLLSNQTLTATPGANPVPLTVIVCPLPNDILSTLSDWAKAPPTPIAPASTTTARKRTPFGRRPSARASHT